MYIYSVNSRRKIVHTGDCFYGKQIKPANRKQVDTIEAVVVGGFCPCRYCNPVVRQFREEQAQVSALCQEGEMTCRPVRRGILVQTPCSEWLIVPSEQVGGSELYHKNAGSGKKQRRARATKEQLYPGFHCQRMQCPTIRGYLQYIRFHDGYRKENPLAPPKGPAPKGSKRYRKEKRRAKRRANRDAAWRVLALLDQL